MVFVFTLIFIVCILLILVVLVQNSKGGGLSSTFGQGNQILGVKQTTDWLEKATWSLAIVLVALCIFSASLSAPESNDTAGGSMIKDQVNSAPVGMENTPAQTPTQE